MDGSLLSEGSAVFYSGGKAEALRDLGETMTGSDVSRRKVMGGCGMKKERENGLRVRRPSEDVEREKQVEPQPDWTVRKGVEICRGFLGRNDGMWCAGREEPKKSGPQSGWPADGSALRKNLRRGCRFGSDNKVHRWPVLASR